MQSFCVDKVFKLTEWVKGDCFGGLISEKEKVMAEWYIRGSSSSHQLITLDSDSFPPLLIRFCDGHADDHVEGCMNEDGDEYDQDQDQDQCKDQNQDPDQMKASQFAA